MEGVNKGVILNVSKREVNRDWCDGHVHMSALCYRHIIHLMSVFFSFFLGGGGYVVSRCVTN